MQQQLDKCLKLLHKMGDSNVKVPTNCYQMLKFPDRRRKTKPIKSKIQHLDYFTKLFPNKIMITDAIKVTSSSSSRCTHKGHISPKLFVPNKLQHQLQDSTKRFKLIPWIIQSQIYALLFDSKYGIWMSFRLPSEFKTQPKSLHQAEARIINLMTNVLKQPVEIFYSNIEYEPPSTSYDYHWWPSWIIYLYIKQNKPEERETLVNKALEALVKETATYRKFTTNFDLYISQN